VNFLGHCFVASWRRGTGDDAAPYAFGSMIPDFTGMAGARLVSVDHAQTAEGVDLHHETDDVFHRSPIFTALMEETRADLEAKGVRRGTSLAVGHVGAELLLDGWLLARDRERGGEVGAFYEASLAAGEGLCHRLRFRGDEGRERMRGLLGRLREYGLDGHESVEVVLRRLERALGHRKRLRILPEDRDAVHEGLVRCERSVAERAQEWVDYLHEHLTTRRSPDRGRAGPKQP
jgi:hypothetical protein